MKTFLEARGDTAIFTFGRFNPPTTGHEKLIDALGKQQSKNAGSLMYVYPSHSQDAKKNPLPHARKVAYMKKMFRKYAKNIITSKARNVFDIAVELHNKGHRAIVMVVGSDRVQEFDRLLNQYNGVDGRHGYYGFDDIRVVSAGERDPDAEGVEGMSASKMRAAAAQGDYDSFIMGLPRNFGDAKKLYDDVRKNMGVREQNWTDEEIMRDAYIRGEVWNVGDVVKTKLGEEGKIIRKGTNYVVFEDMQRIWLHDLEEEPKKITKTKQAKGEVGDMKGTQPAKYYSKDADGDEMSLATKKARARHFAKGDSRKPAPGDKGADTKPSQYTKKFKQMYGEQDKKKEPAKSDQEKERDEFKKLQKDKKVAALQYRMAKDAETVARLSQQEKYDSDKFFGGKGTPEQRTQLLKLQNKALRALGGSPKQKEIKKEIDALRKKMGMKVSERKLTDAEKDKLKKYEKDIDMKDFIDRYGEEEGKSIYYATLTKMAKGESLWANIHKKRQRIKQGSGERMRKKGEKGAPTPAQMKRAKGESIGEIFGISSNSNHRAKTMKMLDGMGIKYKKDGRNGLIILGVAPKDQKGILDKIHKDIGMTTYRMMDEINVPAIMKSVISRMTHPKGYAKMLQDYIQRVKDDIKKKHSNRFHAAQVATMYGLTSVFPLIDYINKLVKKGQLPTTLMAQYDQNESYEIGKEYADHTKEIDPYSAPKSEKIYLRRDKKLPNLKLPVSRKKGRIIKPKKEENEIKEQMEAEDSLKNWKHDDAKSFAEGLIKKYGKPDEVTKTMVKWYKLQPGGGVFGSDARETYVVDESIPHSFPDPHRDFCYTVMEIKVPSHLLDTLGHVTGSIVYDGLKETVTARCGSLEANALTLQFVKDLVSGKIENDNDIAKKTYADRIRNGPFPKSFNPKKENFYVCSHQQEEKFQLDEKIAGLVKKSEQTGVPYGILKKSYDRGMAAWKTGHRPGASQQQWAFARVNSMLTGGKADPDLQAQIKKGGYKKKKKASKESVDEWFYSDETIQLYQERYGSEWEEKLNNTYERMLLKLNESCCEDCENHFDHVIMEAEYQGKKVKLNDPIRTSENPNKKFKVYVKNEKGKVVVVRFGDPNMGINRDDPERRKAFRARHNCDDPGPKTKARYWSCFQWRAGAKVDN